MAVIAMTQEMATLGKDVALGVCEALGVKKSLIRRIREGKASRVEKWAADDRTISIFTAEEVLDLAVKGNVLVRGWGATLLLRSVAHVPCIQVCAPMELRVKRLMERLETDDEALARREIQQDDAARASRMGEYFGVAWGDPTLYDLTINTERVPIPTAVDQVIALVRSPAFQEKPASRAHLEDLALQARARAALRGDDRTSAIDVLVEASGGKLSLRGIVADDRERGLVEQVVSGVPGAKALANELRTMTGGLYRFPSQVKDKG